MRKLVLFLFAGLIAGLGAGLFSLYPTNYFILNSVIFTLSNLCQFIGFFLIVVLISTYKDGNKRS